MIRCKKCRRKISILAAVKNDGHCLSCFEQKIRELAQELWGG